MPTKTVSLFPYAETSRSYGDETHADVLAYSHTCTFTQPNMQKDW